MASLEAYRIKFKEACEEEDQIPKMEIADIRFWCDYIQNHKRIKRKVKKQKPVKFWKQIPDIVLETLNEF